MYIQRRVKGIVGRVERRGDGISEGKAARRVQHGEGLCSNWWRKFGHISPADIENVLTKGNLDRHLHDYDPFKNDTPFISLACGAVERDALVQQNFVYSARDTALMFGFPANRQCPFGLRPAHPARHWRLACQVRAACRGCLPTALQQAPQSQSVPLAQAIAVRVAKALSTRQERKFALRSVVSRSKGSRNPFDARPKHGFARRCWS